MKDVARHALTRMPDVKMTKELEKSPYDQKTKEGDESSCEQY